MFFFFFFSLIFKVERELWSNKYNWEVDQQTRSYFFSELVKEVQWLSIVTSKVLNQSQRKKDNIMKSEFNYEVLVLKTKLRTIFS